MSNLAVSLGFINGLTTTLHRLMHERNITEADLARRTNIPQPTLHKILSGKTSDPRASTLKSLADFFGITIDMLLSGSNLTNAASATPTIKKTHSIAIISWSDCLQANKLIKRLDSTNWDYWIATEYFSSDAYALTSKPSMEPRFPRGSVLVVDPAVIPEDGDMVIVHFDGTEEATLREISIDGPTKELSTICKQPPISTPYNTKAKILGVIVKSIFTFHK